MTTYEMLHANSKLKVGDKVIILPFDTTLQDKGWHIHFNPAMHLEEGNAGVIVRDEGEKTGFVVRMDESKNLWTFPCTSLQIYHIVITILVGEKEESMFVSQNFLNQIYSGEKIQIIKTSYV
jgi:hypothetical protein